MQKILYIPIDITIKNIVECTQLVKRGDTLILQIKVFNNAVLTDLTGQSIDLVLKKADGTLIEKTITSIANGIITASLDVQATNVAGLASGEVQIYTSNTLASTNTFTFIVDSSLADDVLIKSKDDIEVLADLKNVITQGNNAIDKYKTNVEAISGSAGAVEALAGIKTYIDTNLTDLENENAKAVINIQNEKEQNTESVKNVTDLTAVNNTASELKTGLEADINSGNTLKSGLESDITSGNTLKGNLETDFVTGNQLKNDLEVDINNGSTLKSDLDTANTQAQSNIKALNALGDVTTIAQDVTDLKNEVTTARGSETNLDVRLDKIGIAVNENSNKIGDLTSQLSQNTQQVNNLNANKVDKGSPTEFNIPYINSLVNASPYANTYYMNQMNEVTINARYIKSGTSDDIANAIILFTLPVGYRPSASRAFNAQVELHDNSVRQADVVVLTNGNVVLYSEGSIPYLLGQFTISFIGGN